jgi:nucleoside-diphosphate-sugar epimerase
MVCQQYPFTRGQSVLILRPFSVYGPWEAGQRLVPQLLRAVADGTTVGLTAGVARHDFVHVDDIVDAALRAATAQLEHGAAFNLGGGRQTSNEELVALIRRLTGAVLPVRKGGHPRSPCDTDHWLADSRAARRRLAWRPRWRLRAGLAQTWEWWRGRASWPNPARS